MRSRTAADYLHVDWGGDSGTGEFALMALDYLLWTGNETKAQPYLNIAFQVANFFMYHFGGERRYAALERGPFVALLLRCDRVGQLKQLVKHRQHAADCGRVVGAAVGEVLSWHVPVAPVRLGAASAAAIITTAR